MQPVVGRDRNLFEILSLTPKQFRIGRRDERWLVIESLVPITHHVINTMDRGTERREQKQRKKRACQFRSSHPPPEGMLSLHQSLTRFSRSPSANICKIQLTLARNESDMMRM